MPGRHITDCQRRLFLSEQRRTTTEVAAARAGISRASGYRIRGEAGAAPRPRGRRRPDPLASVWESEVVPLLERCPGLRPVAVYRELLRRHAGLSPGVRRTLERRIRAWRATPPPTAQRTHLPPPRWSTPSAATAPDRSHPPTTPGPHPSSAPARSTRTLGPAAGGTDG